MIEQPNETRPSNTYTLSAYTDLDQRRLGCDQLFFYINLVGAKWKKRKKIISSDFFCYRNLETTYRTMSPVHICTKLYFFGWPKENQLRIIQILYITTKKKNIYMFSQFIISLLNINFEYFCFVYSFWEPSSWNKKKTLSICH